MKISIFGLGYVGCVSAACLAHDGHSVIGLDINPSKVQLVRSGKPPVIEAGLEELIDETVRSGRLKASQDSQHAVSESDVSVVCVGTPSNGNGSLSTRYVENVCQSIGQALATKDSYHVVIVRSTVLPRTVEDKLIPILERSSGKKAGIDFGVVMNPEFLREGTAIEDYYHPSYIVLGELDAKSGDIAQDLYSLVEAPIIRTSIKTAEMIKYVSNSWHALKIAFANEIGNFCKVHGIDGQEVMDIFCQDRRLNISATYLRPGFAFGGSCLPKDLRALVHRAQEHDLSSPVLNAVLQENLVQIQRGVELVENAGHRNVGIFGLSFKPGTDDVRESPMVTLAETLIGRGYQVSLYDENVNPEALVGANKNFLERELPHIASLMRPSIQAVVEQSQVLVIGNSSPSFRQIPDLMHEEQVLIDLVGIAKTSGERQGVYEGICW